MNSDLCRLLWFLPLACAQAAPSQPLGGADVANFAAGDLPVLAKADIADAASGSADGPADQAPPAADTADASAEVADGTEGDAGQSADSAVPEASSADPDQPDAASGSDSPACQPAPEQCNGQDDDCNGLTDDGLPDLTCGTGGCLQSIAACLDGAIQECQPLPPAAEACNGLDDDCDGATDEDLGELTCGKGACASSVPACVGGKVQTCTAKKAQIETCNGIDDDCDGLTDEAGATCAPAGTVCKGGKCAAGCQLAGATPCGPGTVCSVGEDNLGQCVNPAGGCVVTAEPAACGGSVCGPGSLCHPQLKICVVDPPCLGVICTGSNCYGTACGCQRPPPPCSPASLAQMNAANFSVGLSDIDMDLQCGLWGVTVISGPDYLRRLAPDGKVQSVTGVANLNMNEVAVLQGFGSTFGGNVVEAALTYGCCAACGCAANPPKGVAWYDKANNALPLLIPTNAALSGPGPFTDAELAIHLNTGPTGLTWGLGNQLYVGNVAENGDLHTVDLAVGKAKLLTKLDSRVYATAPFDGTRLAVALQGKQLVLVHVADGQATKFASTPAEVVALQRDTFTGRLMVALANGEIRSISSAGTDLGVWQTAPAAGRITIGPDGWLYHLVPKVDAPATIGRWQLPQTL